MRKESVRKWKLGMMITTLVICFAMPMIAGGAGLSDKTDKPDCLHSYRRDSGSFHQDSCEQG